jgi:G3E family GTPase
LSAAGPDFIVLTGFLGSGKTTLLRDLLIHPEASDTAVIVNEVGEIGLDGVILREGVGDVPISMLANGCICCQMSSDLAITIDLLLTAPRPPGAPPLRRIVLETSGLSKPGPVLRQLAMLAEHRMAVGVVATFDVTRGIALCAFEEAVAQWAAANRVVMTKTDLVEPQAWQITHNDMFGLNPLAEIIATRTRSEAVQAAFAPLRGVSPVPDRARIPLTATHARIGLCLIRPTGIPAYDDVATWLDNLAGALGERLLRIKGILSVAEGTSPLLFQSVGTVFSQPRPIRSAGETTEPFLVVIVRDAEEQEIALVAPAGVFAAEFRSLAS